jgi:hypothetical protein
MLFANLRLSGLVLEDEHVGLIAVDYQKNETEVYHDLARYFFERLKDCRIFALLDSNEKRRESQSPSWAPDWACPPPPQYSRISDELKNYQYGLDGLRTKASIWASQFQVLLFTGESIGVIQKLGPLIEQPLDPQLAKDFSELMYRNKGIVPKQGLWHFIKSAFEKTYRKWQHFLSIIPDPGRLLEEFEEHFVNGDNSSEENRWRMLSRPGL